MGNDVLSVGIDIGTSTTQVIFSRIYMENISGFFAVPHISIVDKEVIYKSDIYTTPLLNSYLIDGDKIRDIVAGEFKKAGFKPQDTDTGAVIITGESARKDNSALVLEKLSDFAGDFVVSTAGPDLESVIAGKGSGAQSYSEENGCVTVNLDIGGGTTNIVVFDCGKVVSKGCADVGGRLLRVKEDLTVTYVSPTARKISDKCGLGLEVNQKTTEEKLKILCSEMVNAVEQMLGLYEKTALTESIVTKTSSELNIEKPIKAVCFSGGVADCIYKTDYNKFRFGDIGVLLGEAFRQSNLYGKFTVVNAKETIRATVVGAGTYTTSISGSTISYSDGVLPLKNVPVLKLNTEEQNFVLNGNKDFLKEKIKWFSEQSDTVNFVLALPGIKNPSYSQIQVIADTVSSVLDETLQSGLPMLILLETDIAKVTGQVIKRKIKNGRPIISIDGIFVDDGDFLDLGKPLMDGLVIPVVIKTLIFG